MPRRDDIPKFIGVAIAKSPKLVLKLSWRYLKIKKMAQRAETTFRRRLEASGMDRETSERLAGMYASTVSLKEMLHTFGVPGRALDNGHP